MVPILVISGLWTGLPAALKTQDRNFGLRPSRVLCAILWYSRDYPFLICYLAMNTIALAITVYVYAAIYLKVRDAFEETKDVLTNFSSHGSIADSTKLSVKANENVVQVVVPAISYSTSRRTSHSEKMTDATKLPSSPISFHGSIVFSDLIRPSQGQEMSPPQDPTIGYSQEFLFSAESLHFGACVDGVESNRFQSQPNSSDLSPLSPTLRPASASKISRTSKSSVIRNDTLRDTAPAPSIRPSQTEIKIMPKAKSCQNLQTIEFSTVTVNRHTTQNSDASKKEKVHKNTEEEVYRLGLFKQSALI
ncbi:hypothetical protein HDU99_001776, partial [Rhizoclosmatium hyalinum]